MYNNRNCYERRIHAFTERTISFAYLLSINSLPLLKHNTSSAPIEIESGLSRDWRSLIQRPSAVVLASLEANKWVLCTWNEKYRHWIIETPTFSLSFSHLSWLSFEILIYLLFYRLHSPLVWVYYSAEFAIRVYFRFSIAINFLTGEKFKWFMTRSSELSNERNSKKKLRNRSLSEEMKCFSKRAENCLIMKAIEWQQMSEEIVESQVES